MKKKNWYLSPFLMIMILFFPVILFAQENSVDMADIMHENGKIYVVVAVIAVILAAFLIALISIDRRVRQIERNNTKD